MAAHKKKIFIKIVINELRAINNKKTFPCNAINFFDCLLKGQTRNKINFFIN